MRENLLLIEDVGKIRASCERKQKTDRPDAELLLRLLAEDRFPWIWVPTAAERDDRQLLLHRHKLVRMRTQVKNQLQALALNQRFATQPEFEELRSTKSPHPVVRPANWMMSGSPSDENPTGSVIVGVPERSAGV